MPDLGKYADAVLGSYLVSISLIITIVALSLWRSSRVKAELDRIESETRKSP